MSILYTIFLQHFSLCEIQQFSIILHLLFFTIFLIRFAWTTLNRTRTHLTDAPCTHPTPLTSKLPLISSLVLVLTHMFLLSATLYGYPARTTCVSNMAAETVQTIAPTISLFCVHKVMKSMKPRFPFLLRTWWLSYFIFSLLRTSAYAVVGPRTLVHSLFEILDLLSSTVLASVAFYGNKQMEKHWTTEPLLTKKEIPVEVCYESASPLELVTFSWLTPFFEIGRKKALEMDDLPPMGATGSARSHADRLDCILRAISAKDVTPDPSIYKAVFLFSWKKALANAIFAVTTSGLSYVGPLLISRFVNHLGRTGANCRLSHGYVLVSCILLAKVAETVLHRQWVFGLRRLNIYLRAALVSRVYKKCLKVKWPKGGEVINYMSVDIPRVTSLVGYLNMVWSLPIQIGLAIYILRENIGAAGSWAALGATLALMAGNIPVVRLQRKYQGRIMKEKDERLKVTMEVIKGMGVLKLQGWERRFMEKVEQVRRREYTWVWRSQVLAGVSTFIFWGAPTIISVVGFGSSSLAGVRLTAGEVLSALATFQMLQEPIFNLPDVVSAMVQGRVSIDRVGKYLKEEEKEEVESIGEMGEVVVEIKEGEFGWGAGEGGGLKGIDLEVRKGMKVAVCGGVGAGKSSLLGSVLGEMEKRRGALRVQGRRSYVGQRAWLVNGTVRENILFGEEYERGRYERVVKGCGLEKDLEMMVGGDLTEIGERGINLSGGQKQRVQMARALYHDADLFLLDDPFSAVDAVTGSILHKECVMGILKEKTVIYVTHQVEFLPEADLILVMEGGTIKQAGKFEELMRENSGFQELVGAHCRALGSMAEEVPENPKKEVEGDAGKVEKKETIDSSNDTHSRNEEKGKIVREEERRIGRIPKEVYFSYFRAVKGGIFIPVIVLVQVAFQVLQIAGNYWIASSSPVERSETKEEGGLSHTVAVYSLLAGASSACILVRTMLLACIGLVASQKFFTDMLRCLVRAPMSFFDSTPSGRILNRASKDQSTMDMEIPNRLGVCAFSIIQIIGTVVVMSQAVWEVFLVIIPVTGACFWYQQYFIKTARELSRLDSMQMSPVIHHFSETISGTTTIRAFNQEVRFGETNLRLIDNHSSPWFHNVCAIEWLSFRMNQLSNLVFAFSLFLVVSLPPGIINPSSAGLAITYGISLNVLQSAIIWNLCSAENRMVAVERIIQYSNLESEAPLTIEENRPAGNWPDTGAVTFTNLKVRYADHFPLVLNNITCNFPGGSKVGVVGRTGSGKSTLVQAMFRIVEAEEGSIVIDGIDISRIGLHDLRSKLSIIPQEPTMFQGTVRGNIDPLMEHSDMKIWEVLDKCQLGDLVRGKDSGLDSPVAENGENWSVGERQLLCLGRALLKKSKILVLDEATASVDSATDAVIQKIIRREFNDRTIITIAHRIHTVVDSDLILALSDGTVAEFDTPAKLREIEDSCFSKLIKEYSARSRSVNI